MSTLHSLIAAYQFNRPRTLGLLDKIEAEKEPQKILGWRPGPGRAHIAWQLTHIGVTEELFATERLAPGTKPAFADLVPRFKGGSTPDDEIPQAALILSPALISGPPQPSIELVLHSPRMINRAPSLASSDNDSRGFSPTPTDNMRSIRASISADGDTVRLTA